MKNFMLMALFLAVAVLTLYSGYSTWLNKQQAETALRMAHLYQEESFERATGVLYAERFLGDSPYYIGDWLNHLRKDVDFRIERYRKSKSQLARPVAMTNSADATEHDALLSLQQALKIYNEARKVVTAAGLSDQDPGDVVVIDGIQ